MGDKQQFTLAADVSSLPKGRAIINEVCQKLLIDEQMTYDILLAVDEVLSNVIEHGYAGLEPGEMILAWSQENGRLILEITDFGRVFQPREPQTPDIEAIFESGRQGGLGLFIVYQIMDDVSYQSAADGNKTTLVKNLT